MSEVKSFAGIIDTVAVEGRDLTAPLPLKKSVELTLLANDLIEANRNGVRIDIKAVLLHLFMQTEVDLISARGYYDIGRPSLVPNEELSTQLEQILWHHRDEIDDDTRDKLRAAIHPDRLKDINPHPNRLRDDINRAVRSLIDEGRLVISPSALNATFLQYVKDGVRSYEGSEQVTLLNELQTTTERYFSLLRDRPTLPEEPNLEQIREIENWSYAMALEIDSIGHISSLVLGKEIDKTQAIFVEYDELRALLEPVRALLIDSNPESATWDQDFRASLESIYVRLDKAKEELRK